VGKLGLGFGALSMLCVENRWLCSKTWHHSARFEILFNVWALSWRSKLWARQFWSVKSLPCCGFLRITESECKAWKRSQEQK